MVAPRSRAIWKNMLPFWHAGTSGLTAETRVLQADDRPNRSHFVPGLVLGLGLGLVLGHWTVWRDTSPANGLSLVSPHPASLARFPNPALDVNDFSGLTPPSSRPREWKAPDEVAVHTPLVNAIAVDSSTDHDSRYPGELIPVGQFPAVEPKRVPVHEEPQTLPFGATASPLSNDAPSNSNSQSDLKTIRELIELEMPHFTEEQRQVWFESLKDVKKEDVAGILKMWKLIGGPVPGLTTPGATSGGMVDPYFGGDHPAPLAKSLASGRTRFELLRELVRQNLAQSMTPGYIPRQPNRDLLSDSETYERGAIGWPDFNKVKLVKTEFPLDLSISGLGFFELTNADGKKFYTRSGRFHLNEERQIVLSVDGQDLLLSPGLKIEGSDNSEEHWFTIHPNGVVALRARDEEGDYLGETTSVGTIPLFLFASSTSLQCCGNGLFEVVPDGYVLSQKVTAPNRKSTHIRQGTLEYPVVNLEEQKALLEWMQMVEDLK